MSHNKTQQLKSSAHQQAHKASRHPALIYMARAGFVVSGLLHIMIGWIALKIALGTGGGEASNSGALSQIAHTPGGQILLWVMAIALLGLGLWRLLEIFVASEAKDKAKSGAVGVVFMSLVFTTFTFARGGSSSDGQKTTSITAQVLQWPGGKTLIVIAGLVVIGVGIYGVVKGATRKFTKDLEAGAGAGQVGSAITVAGTAGYIARGIAFLVLGSLIIWGALTSDPQKASGLDSALRTIGEQPFGVVLLVLTAIGFALYGIYSMARAKYTNEI
ncbi:MAG: DUF1206 domain-containing protein [Rothia sp. (in: high G+C Gram-positive bacteria)]|nr:DUF1206 domain-containing protein [Rothia sp. (in: high G+C Gram-positive bacteria)]